MVTDTPHAIADDLLADDDGFFSQGRTSLNICELPFFVPYNLPRSKPEHIIEAPPIVDKATGAVITRRITIFPSPRYGYPRLLDNRVLDAIVTLSQREHDFTSNRVHANRYDIAKLLDRDTGGRPYAEVRESQKRLTQVNYTIEHAWKGSDGGIQSSEEDFSLLDRVETRSQKGKRGRYSEIERETAFYVFGDKLFESLKDKKVRRLDFRIANRLSSPVAYRANSFLQKRWHQSDEVDLDFEQYYHFHLGLSPNQKPSRKRGNLIKPHGELEALGVLAPAEDKDRYYTSKKTGRQRIRLFKERRTQVAVTLPATRKADRQIDLPLQDPLTQELIGRGLKAKSAREVVANYDQKHIRHCIELVDYKIAQGEKIPSPHGLIYTAIVDGPINPKGFQSGQQKKEAEDAKKQHLEQFAKLRKAATGLPEADKKKYIKTMDAIFRRLCGDGTIHTVEKKAIAKMSPAIMAGYYKWRNQEGKDERQIVYVVAYVDAMQAVLDGQ